jgi:radical SAM protein (TIGR01212 family)
MQGKRYYRKFSEYLMERFGEKVYRVCIDAGFTCPNRDGTLGTGGCAYCSECGSWGKRGETQPIELQIRREKKRVAKRYGARKYIAYFQAFTNTYAPAAHLKGIYDSVLLQDSDFVGVAIGTRPDCIDHEKLEVISSYKRAGLDVWMEYGLQSAHDSTLSLIGRGHDVRLFTQAVLETRSFDLNVLAHVIVGLPGEGRAHNVETAEYLSGLPIAGLKLHNLNIVRGTRMADWYREGKVQPLSLDEYAHRVVDFLERIAPEVVIARLTADTQPDLLIAPHWSLDKPLALDRIQNTFAQRKSYQGRIH